MVRLVLGIVVIGILQFGFVMYSRLHEPVDLALAPVQIESYPALPEFDSSDTVSSSSNEIEEEPAVPVRVTSRRAHLTAPTRSKSGSYKRRPSRSAKPQYSALPSDFRTIVISYNAPSAAHSPRRNCDSPEPERPRSRNAFARAEPAAVRPWQVITTYDPRIN